MVSEAKLSILRKIYFSAIEAVNPFNATIKFLPEAHERYKKFRLKKLFVAGAGKASVKMARAVEEYFKELITDGIIITPYGNKERHKKIKIFEASHPLPDRNGLNATKKIIQLLESADSNTLVIFLISGGGSSLLVYPSKPITLTDKIIMTKLLMNSGVTIEELNTVRKHISQVKGGNLARLAYPARMISFIISDVISDNEEVIASGPVSPDSTTFKDAYDIIKKYKLINKTPARILKHLKDGINGKIEETPKRNDKIFRNVKNIVVASNKIAIESARKCAERYGYHTEIITTELSGDAVDAGRELAKIALKYIKNAGKNKRICLLSGGETTVKVKGKGIGGRNQELALAFSQEISGTKGITMLSAGTDGIDGTSPAAGAIVDGETIPVALKAGLEPNEFLENNDSYNFFKKTGNLFVPGPTGTNVMDIQIILVEL